ncbi:alpha/beta hydrolase [Pseudomonas sp. RIT-PI-S]|uniref:alpha/beta fold hydrolase n=1 Tax=Pseudomonas sp. RIT-PI-S TaxID=3035295 RepID=UPI0021DADE56|nr:alpha/beta hydrolase [Pseudomonas sp. RIT-PI-S]
MRLRLIAFALAALLAPSLHADQQPLYGPQLEGFDYPYTLQHYRFESQGASLEMGYMDVAAGGRANGHTVVLLHGKNFCAATWEATIKVLSDAGYRVIAPDQVGFCTSSKPEHYQYSFQQLANNTHNLLLELGIKDAIVLGHSTGGMLAARYALLYPEETERLLLVNPIGLEDWKALGVPYRSVDEWFAREVKLNVDSIREYERKTYYSGRWAPAYERWVTMLAGLNQGPGHNVVAWNSALIYDMIFTQPVYYEFGNIKVPTLLLIGTADTTAIGSDVAPPEVKARLGHYDVLGKQASQRIPGATLVEFPGLGHAPQMEEPKRFHKAVLDWLGQPATPPTKQE